MIAMASARVSRAYLRGAEIMPGVLIAFVIAAAALFLSEHYGGPAMLFALLLGMALHFLATHEKPSACCASASRFSGRGSRSIRFSRWAPDRSSSSPPAWY
jgi:hypothetical protein